MKIFISNASNPGCTPLVCKIYNRIALGNYTIELSMGDNFDTSPKIVVSLTELKKALIALTPNE